MYSRIISCTLIGIQGNIVYVEVDIRDGLPCVLMVGHLSLDVRESKERVITAIKHIGIQIPPKKITINLSPAEIRKEGSAFDLPIAVAILSSYGYFPTPLLQHICFLGELSLNGRIRPVKGVLPMVLHAKEQGISCCVVPYENRLEASIVEGIHLIAVHSLQQLMDCFKSEEQIKASYFIPNENRFNASFKQTKELNFKEVIGQGFAKRAAEIAAAGMHNLLLIGTPGTGKSMIASRMPSIMPILSTEESMELTKIYSIRGELKEEQGLMTTRPFRNPHHTITQSALIGGGRYPMPGEISMAHKGILFLDELAEFARGTLEVLRQPLEEKQVWITRVNGTVIYPSDILLIGAMNPCPCGYFPDRTKCRCTSLQIRRYLGKISRPLLERMDLIAEVSSMSYEALEGDKIEEDSQKIKERVEQAVFRQKKRYEGLSIDYNSQLSGDDIKKFCIFDQNVKKVLRYVFEKRQWSIRTYHHVLKIARTIADLEGSECILEQHMIEAIAYRGLEQKYWG